MANNSLSQSHFYLSPPQFCFPPQQPTSSCVKMSLELVEIAGENEILDNETTLKKQSWWSKNRPRTCWGYWWISKRIPITKWILEYKRKDIINDLIAGLTVAAMAIPQSLAHATVAGMSTNRGLHTELFPGLMYLFFGSTKYTIICKCDFSGRFP